MQFKQLLISALLFNPLVSGASVLVNAPAPYPQYEMGASDIEIYFAGRNGATAPSIVSAGFNDTKGYRYITTDSATSTGLLYIDVSTDSNLTVPSGSSIFVSLKATNATTQIVLTGASLATGTSAPSACVVGSNCITGNKGAYYTAGSTLRLSFTVSALCAASASGGGLCSASTVLDATGTTLSQSVEVFFGVVSNASVPSGDNVFAATTNTSDTITIGFTDIEPTIATCPLVETNYYFPGDGQIYYYPTTASASANGGVDLQYLITMALKDSTPATDVQSGGLSSNSIVHYTPAGNSIEAITGFINTTTGTDNVYSIVVQAQNEAGIVSTTKCDFNNVKSQDISGVLKESKCFIATAAYQDGKAAPVMMLRKFRDQILSKFSLGRDFIKNYYRYSPPVAEWAWDKPIIRSIALKLLTPIELMAWAILKFSNAEEAATESSSQPYIDRLKKYLPPQTEEQANGSFLDQEKKRLEEVQEVSKDANEPYIDRLKKKLAEEEQTEASAEGYAEKERSKLPAVTERESPITLVKEGRDRKLDFGDIPDVSNAVGLKLGITPGMQISAEGSSHTFNEVYGTGFHPELMFHYERQLFHSENFGSFGLGADLGLAYSGAKGLLQFGFNNSNQSITGFSFYQFPLLINAIYRFNLLRIVRPYVSAGGGVIGYLETREDEKADKRGYSVVYNGSVGASLLLDFLDSSTHRDSFLSNGFQHTYLFVEYLYLNSIKSSVSFKRAGIYSGFLFEF